MFKIFVRLPLRLMLRFIFRLLFRIRVQGEFQTTNERLVIISNHQSFLDGLILGLMLPIDPIFVINTHIAKRPLIRFFLNLVDYLVVDPVHPMAIKTVVRLIEKGRPVVIFPEGRITTTGNLMKIYEGSAFVVAKTGATVIPVIVQGAIFSHLSKMGSSHPKRWFPRITLSYSEPTRLEIPSTGSPKWQRARAGDLMRALLQKAMFEARTPNDLLGAYLDSMYRYGKSRIIAEDVKGVTYTYRKLLMLSLALGRLLTRHSDVGEKVGVLMPTAVPTVGLIFGLSAFGRVPAMLNFTAGIDGMQAACKAAEIKTIITSRQFVEQAKLTEKIEVLNKTIRILYLEELRQQITLWDKLWLMAYAIHFPGRVILQQNPKEPAVVLFTSGSEGKPKGVVLSHEALLANIAQISSIVDFSTEDRMLNALPIFHSFGLTAGALLPIFRGFFVFLYPSPLHYRVIPEVAYDRSCTILLGTNTFLLHYGRQAHPYDFYRLRYAIAGAEKLSDSVRMLWFEKFGIRIFEGYGATETAPVISVNTPLAYKAGSVGQILPGIEHRLLPVPGIEEGGVLHVKGANVMSGYLRSENPGLLERPSSELGEGWYETGDIVSIDENGFVFIKGRVKRFAKISGEMVSLEMVESLALKTLDGLHAAISKPDPARGEMIVLFTTKKELTRESLQKSAQVHGYPEIALPRKIIYLENLPLLGTGKTDYVTLKSMAEGLA